MKSKKGKRVISTFLRPSEVALLDSAEVVPTPEFEQRCTFLLDLTREVFNLTSPQWWKGANLTTLAHGLDPNGDKLPPSGFVAASRLGWSLVCPEGLYLPDRFKRGVLTRLMSTFRAQGDRTPLFHALLSLVDDTGLFDLKAVRATPAGQFVSHDVASDLAVSIHSFRKRGNRDPVDLTELRPAPSVKSPVFPFSACDDHFQTLAREVLPDGTPGSALLLQLKLPVIPRPLKKTDWVWHTLHLELPGHRQEVTDWAAPDMLVRARKLLFSCASLVPAPEKVDTGVALGVDWSPGSLMCVGVVREAGGTLVTHGQASGWDEGGKISKVLRIQKEAELTRKKYRQIRRLIDHRPGHPVNAALEVKAEVLYRQAELLGTKQARVGADLAWQGANHLLDQAQRYGASLIGFEDLRDLDPIGRGAFQNNRSAQSVRGKLYACMEQLGKKHGIEVVQVPCRGTSSRCPGCNGEIDNSGDHYASWCAACELGGNRDAAACVNIAKRALLGRHDLARPKGRAVRVKTVQHRDVMLGEVPEQSTPKTPRKAKGTRSRSMPPKRAWRDRKGNRHAPKPKKAKKNAGKARNTVVPTRASMWAQVKRGGWGIQPQITQSSLVRAGLLKTGTLKNTVLDGVPEIISGF